MSATATRAATPSRAVPAGGSRPSPGRRRRRIKQGLTPWLFLLPALAIFAIFKFWPVLYGMWLSFFEVRPYLGNLWIGLGNFERAVTDPALGSAALHTLIDAAAAVGLSMLFGFLLALLLEGPALHLRLIRTAAFLPVVAALVVVAQLWDVIMYPSSYGMLNSFLGFFGMGPNEFLSDPDQALASVILIQVWKHAPYDMVIFIAGLAGIDRQLYEAADIDGANRWQRLRFITIPALRPVITIVLMLGIIRGLRVFTEVFVLTNGGPAGATEMIVTYLYKTGIELGDFGYASAISTMLLLVTIVATSVTNWIRGRKED
ncbi:MAG: sugar ABC transporter permease [Propionibacteriaceae bacterium]|nr:sugar ABC transporter permease [Propionibacteriaceae bacterium]